MRRDARVRQYTRVDVSYFELLDPPPPTPDHSREILCLPAVFDTRSVTSQTAEQCPLKRRPMSEI